MAGQLRGLSALLAATGLTAASAAKAGEDPKPPLALIEDGDESTPVVLETDAIAAVNAAKAQGRAEGIAAERTRTSEVLASEPAKANIGAAAFCLARTDATSADIIKDLPTLAAPAPVPVAQAPAPPALTVDLSEAPKANLGAPGGSANSGSEETVDTDKMWAEVRARNAMTEGGLPRQAGAAH